MSNIKLKYKTKTNIQPSTALPVQEANLKVKGVKAGTTIKEFFQSSSKRIWNVIKGRKFLAIVGLILLVSVSFFAGVKVGPYLGGDNPTKNIRNNPLIERIRPSSSPNTNRDSGSSPTNSRNSVFNGKITTINPIDLIVIDKDGQTKKFLFNEKTVVVSKDGKTITNDELQIGYTVIIYATQSDGETLNISRLKILELN